MRKCLSPGLHRLVMGVLGLVLLLAGATHAQNPSIEGTYKLISRQLPDGTTKTAPGAIGLLTFTKTHRNLNVVWEGPNDVLCSYSLSSSYKIRRGKFTENILFSSLNDHMVGQKAAYDLVGKNQTARVVTGEALATEKLSVDLPTIVINGNRIISTAEGPFVDTWEKVEENGGAQAAKPE